MGETFERIVTFTPAYDGRHGSPQEWRSPGMKPSDGTDNTNYGIGGVHIDFTLKGSQGAISFSMFTDWFPPYVQDEHIANPPRHRWRQPTGAGVDYHSPRPMYEGQSPCRKAGDCEYVPDGSACYSDGSSLLAEEWVDKILLAKGSEGVWEALEAMYHERFDSQDACRKE
jgi:hypothetical protein